LLKGEGGDEGGMVTVAAAEEVNALQRGAQGGGE
jgi:hypothetical protein